MSSRDPHAEVQRSVSIPELEVWRFFNWMRPGTYCAPSVTLTAPASRSIGMIKARSGGQRQVGDASSVLIAAPDDALVVERLSGVQPEPGECTIVGITVPSSLIGDRLKKLVRSGVVATASGRSFGRELAAIVTELSSGDAPRCGREELVMTFVDRVLGADTLLARPPSSCSRSAERSRDYIHAHYGEPFSLDAMASTVGLSKWHLTRSFRAQFGVSPGEYTRALRAQQAFRLVRSGADLQAVAVLVGYSDQAHMTRELRAIGGLTPARYGRRAKPLDPLARR